MSVIINNLVFNGLFAFRRNLNILKIKLFRFLRNDKMTADFSVMIKNGHSYSVFILNYCLSEIVKTV